MRRRRDSGAAAVEFAIILPLLLLIIAGVIDFGRAFFTQIVITNAAREGARAAVVGADWSGRAQASIAGVPGATVSATPSTGCTAASAEEKVKIEVAAGFSWIVLGPAMNFFGGGGSLPTTLSSSATMQCGG